MFGSELLCAVGVEELVGGSPGWVRMRCESDWVGGWVPCVSANALPIRLLRQTDTAAAADVASAKPRGVQAARSSAMPGEFGAAVKGFAVYTCLGTSPALESRFAAGCTELPAAALRMYMQHLRQKMSRLSIDNRRSAHKKNQERDLRLKGGRVH